MAESHRTDTDKNIGYAIVLAAIAVAGTVAMLAIPGGLVAAGGLTVAVLAGLVLVLLFHLDL